MPSVRPLTLSEASEARHCPSEPSSGRREKPQRLVHQVPIRTCRPHPFPSLSTEASSVCMGEALPQWTLLPGAVHSRSPRCRLHLSSHTPTLGSGPVPSPCRLQYQSVQLKGDDGCHSTLPTVTLKNKQKRIPLSQSRELPSLIHSSHRHILNEHLLWARPKVGLGNLAVGSVITSAFAVW